MIELNGKSLIFTDIHFGRKNFNYEKTQSTIEYMRNEINLHREQGIQNLFILGDLWDHRKFIDWSIFNMVNKFFKELKDMNIIMVIGNHDIYHKNRIDENALEYFSDMFENITVISQTQFVKFNDKNLLFVPWLIDHEDENNPTDLQIKETDMILGHFEFINFELMPGVTATHGFDSEKYKNTKLLSGHYHTHSEKNEIKYLGVCEQMSWADFNSRKGYHVLNEDLSLDFQENITSEKFIKIIYDDTKEKSITVQGHKINENIYYNKIQDVLSEVPLQRHNIKVQINQKKSKKDYNNFLIGLDMNHIEYTLIDNTPEMLSLVNLNHEEDIDNQNISEMILSMIQESDKNLFSEIYNEAIQMEDL